MDTKSSSWRGASKSLCLAIFSFFFVFQNYPNTSVMFVQATSNVHIVYMGERQYEDPASVRKLHHKMLSTLLGSKEAARSSILYSYKHGFSGFAARLTKSQAEKIAEFPGVVQVFPNGIQKFHTTRSWDFLGLHHYSRKKNLTTEGNMGDGTIIGVIDSGIWPESESFNDEGMGPIPPHWKGTCQHGEHFNHSNCNKKLIGARWFIEGLRDQMKIPINTTNNIEFLSPRDRIGHGTHTASTAAGGFVEKANYKGLAWGVARGGAPRAHLAIYKACWAIGTGRCTDADILKAFDKAIEDGVDILSVSLGIEIPLFSYVDRRDSIAIGSFHATTKGITVVSSGGNDGPFSQTIVNTAPWLITVAATTIDRDFPTAITFGNNHTLMGQSHSTGKHKHRFTGLVYSERIASDSTDDSAKGCHLGSLNTTLAAGKFVLCFSLPNQQNMVSASRAVKNAGGIGLIYAQFDDNLLDSCDVIPCIRVDYEAGTQILTYIRKARNPTVKLSFPRTVIGETMSPRVAYFSSRGPSSMSPAVLKPDVAAPGVSILAAYPPMGTKHGSGYAFLSGTSMACPHVTGIVALIKSAHPDWSPAAIRSALVTTASQKGTDGMDITEMGPTLKKADPFDIGGGHVNPNRAINPGLIYNISKQDYIQFMCAMGYSNISISRLTKTTTNCMKSNHFLLNLNLPSITIPNLKRTVTVLRIVSNVGDINSEYKVQVEAPYGVQMVVEPQILRFNSTIRALPFKVTFFSTRKMHGDYRFGSLVWTDGKHFVKSPISIRAIKFDSYADV
ncbi:subtilisin-like protease SBT3.4 isoform X1 [Camellia sinensis]|uniref:subtilisin-like protease SBT3.4 isoform X1 n=1 Tax=Camellia sinensis TaxID=4442 RepID=UPI001036838A|nr:subtilisin-like protease SBT3.4 isoform X1 [Camellia sinensis]